jgi:secreted PhoX family phosphatase
MQLKNILFAASFALCASAASNNATDIAASVQNRLASLELGYLHTNIILDQVTAGTEGVDAKVSISWDS